jgi:U3 small nucleolar RNA-associated protein 13
VLCSLFFPRTFQGHLSTVLRVRFLSCGLQLVSSGSDGLIKLWTVRTNECEATLDGHAHKVWALDVREAPPGGDAGGRPIMVSGGGDSRLVAWVDTTVEEAQARRQEAHENVLLDQQLAGHLRRKEYREALGVTLRRDKPLQAFKVLVSIIESDLEKDPNSNGVPAVRALARRWTDDELVRVLRYCREWNARARTCHVAMVTVNAVVSSIPLPKLAELESVPEVLAGILVYAERHRERLDRLRTSAYLLDYVLSNMGSLDGVEVASADTSADDFIEWEQRTMDHRLVLPPKRVDGRIQVGGTAVVGCGAGAGAGGLESGGVPMGVSSGESVETVTAEDSDNSSSSAEGG